MREFPCSGAENMPLKRNFLSNFVSQLYVAMNCKVTVPMYLRYIGAVSYRLVGCFAMMQAWFGLLDMGLTLTMSEETAWHKAKAADALTPRRLGRGLDEVSAASG